ncbi:TPA: hypothetical protein QB252_001734 [Pasteurella multocida]|nr:hypothetical protein [Pasteurella multocida]
MDKVKELLEKHGFKIYSSPPERVWSKREQDNVSLVCSCLNEVMLVSISHSGVRNPRKAKQIIQSVFGGLYQYEQNKHGDKAVYFNLTRLS